MTVTAPSRITRARAGLRRHGRLSGALLIQAAAIAIACACAAAPAHAACPAASNYTTTVLADAPWGYWPLADATGSVASECSGKASRDATYTGTFPALAASGQVNGTAAVVAPSFGGAAYVVLPTLPATSSGGPISATAGAGYTFEVWLWYTVAQAANSGIFSFGAAGGAVGQFNDILIQMQGSGLTWYSYVGASYSGPVSATLTASTWHHLVATAAVTGGSATVTVYVDGAVAGSSSLPTPSDLERVYASVGRNLAGNYFVGQMAEFAIYPTALSADRVATHWHAGIAARPVVAPTASLSGAAAVIQKRAAALAALKTRNKALRMSIQSARVIWKQRLAEIKQRIGY